MYNFLGRGLIIYTQRARKRDRVGGRGSRSSIHQWREGGRQGTPHGGAREGSRCTGAGYRRRRDVAAGSINCRSHTPPFCEFSQRHPVSCHAPVQLIGVTEMLLSGPLRFESRRNMSRHARCSWCNGQAVSRTLATAVTEHCNCIDVVWGIARLQWHQKILYMNHPAG